MKSTITRFLTALLLITLAGLGHAQQLPLQQEQSDLNRNAEDPSIRNAPTNNGRITRQQAVNLAKQRFAGNILRISPIGEGENQRYQIRMENEGKVFTVFVHATTGKVSGPG